ncbi:MAG: LytTR family DNA-binding domain-containing protein [Blastocatellia bacterium]|nr:LytTR family DNA-binding domain-containing protein [Blastocatellia bacterium]
MSELRVLIVDDEAPARRKIRRFLEADASIRVTGEAATGLEALEQFQSTKPDIIFLDVNMPGLDGFGFLAALQAEPRPLVVFVTAYDQFALKAFEVAAFDYVLKPFDPDRFQQVLQRIKEQIALQRKSELGANLHNLLQKSAPRFPEHVLVESKERAFFLAVLEIDWLEAARNSVTLHTQGKTFQVRGTLEGLAQKLDPQKFIQVNRSHIVRLESIQELQPWFHGEYRILLKDGTELMWSRRFLDRLPDLVNKSRAEN